MQIDTKVGDQGAPYDCIECSILKVDVSWKPVVSRILCVVAVYFRIKISGMIVSFTTPVLISG